MTTCSFSGPEIPLGDSCTLNLDVCEDGNAHCINGRCECEFGYTEENNMCGKLLVIV